MVLSERPARAASCSPVRPRSRRSPRRRQAPCVCEVGNAMSMAAGISTYRGSPRDGGRDIRPTAEEVRAHLYGLVVAWGNAHGLPSDVAYAARLEKAHPPSGSRGRPVGMPVERLRLAETARAWRAQGWDERTIAYAAAWGPEDTASKTADELRSKRLKRLESDLRKLERIEGVQPTARPERDTVARRAAPQRWPVLPARGRPSR